MIHTLYRGLQRLSLLSGLLLMLVGGRLWQVAPPSDTCTVWVIVGEYGTSSVALDGTGQRVRLQYDENVIWLKHRAFTVPRLGADRPLVQLSNRAAHALKDDGLYTPGIVMQEPTQGWIYYERRDYDDIRTTELYRMDRHGNQHQLVWTVTQTLYTVNTTTNDGRSILYYTLITDENGVPQGQLIVIDTLTGTARVVASGLQGDVIILAWHTGRREIIYSTGWSRDRFRVSMDGGEPQLLEMVYEYIDIWRSGDQDPTLLYTVYDYDNGYSLYRLDWDATTGQRLIEMDWEDRFIAFVGNDHALFWNYHWDNSAWTITRLNIDTGEVHDYAMSFYMEDFHWFPDEPHSVFISDESPPRLMAFYPTTETFEALTTLPSNTSRVGIAPCGKQYWYRHGKDLVLAHLDNGPTTVLPNSADITPRQWLAFEPPRWHPRLALGGGALLSGVGLVGRWRRVS